jgi:hypothetical protein
VAGATVAADGAANTLTLDAAGTVTVWLSHGQSITFEGVSGITQVQIVETTDSNYSTSYTDSKNPGTPTPASGTALRVVGGANRTFDFINNRGGVPDTGVSAGSAGAGLLGLVTLGGALGAFLTARTYRRRRRAGGVPPL